MQTCGFSHDTSTKGVASLASGPLEKEKVTAAPIRAIMHFIAGKPWLVSANHLVQVLPRALNDSFFLQPLLMVGRRARRDKRSGNPGSRNTQTC